MISRFHRQVEHCKKSKYLSWSISDNNICLFSEIMRKLRLAVYRRCAKIENCFNAISVQAGNLRGNNLKVNC